MLNLTLLLSIVSLALAAPTDTSDSSDLISLYNPEKDVVFYLYTCQNKNDPQVIQLNNQTSLEQSFFDPNLPTRFLVHGWLYNFTLFFVQEGKDAYLSKGCFNVIAVDWSKGGSSPLYPLPALRVQPTGQVLGQFIQFLISAGGASLSDIIPIGFSLGAHVVGNAGRALNGQLDIVVGLDPAGPMFTTPLPLLARLQQSDAKFVLAAHTSAQFSGTFARSGHADFYFNGGYSQPGCSDNVALLDDGCSHNRSPYYFIESIKGQTPFIGTHCEDDQVATLPPYKCDLDTSRLMVFGGEPINTSNSGVFYVETNSQPPFAKPYITPQ